MSDHPSFRRYKLSQMTPEERVIAKAYYRAAEQAQAAEAAIDAHFRPLIEACATRDQAEVIMRRVPLCGAWVLLTDYMDFARDWAKSHDECFGAAPAACSGYPETKELTT